MKQLVGLRSGQLQNSIASRLRGAWIETDEQQVQRLKQSASPLGYEGRGLKQQLLDVAEFQWLASPLGYEGRGLKRFRIAGNCRASNASPLGYEGRGLKHSLDLHTQ